MGDRAVIHFHNRVEVSPAIYLHWGGRDVKKLIGKVRHLMRGRGCDVQYTAARFVGICHETYSDQNTGLGMFNAPNGKDFEEVKSQILDTEYSHGDAGVFLVDCYNWTIDHSE